MSEREDTRFTVSVSWVEYTKPVSLDYEGEPVRTPYATTERFDSLGQARAYLRTMMGRLERSDTAHEPRGDIIAETVRRDGRGRLHSSNSKTVYKAGRP